MNFFRFLIILVTLGSVSGCYTELGITKVSPTAEKSVTVADPQEQSQSHKDTLVVIPANRYCVWQRDYWGEWNLNCYSSVNDMYGYSFYHSPWWYDHWWGHMNCDCPFNSYYMCQDYCEKNFGFTETETSNNSSISSTNKNSTKKNLKSSIAPGTEKNQSSSQVIVGPKPSKKRPSATESDNISSTKESTKEKSSAESETDTKPVLNNNRPTRRRGRTR